MTLEELKALFDAAQAASAAAPDDESLKTKAQEAKDAYDAKLAEGSNTNPDELDESKLDEKTKAHIAKLRKENASQRLKTKDFKSKHEASEAQKKAILIAAGIEVETENPEEKLKVANTQVQQQAFRTAILESALENSIPKDGVEYFEFLITKATNALEEGEELPEDKIAEIVKAVKKQHGKGSATTKVEGDGTTPNPEADAGKITFDQFCRMSVTEKSNLYLKNPDLYTKYANEAKSKKKLV